MIQIPKYSQPSKVLKILSVAFAFSLILFINQTNQLINAQATKTLDVKAELDKSVIQIGKTQHIHIKVFDSESKQPISGAWVSAVVTYPNGELVRTFNTFSDSTGHATISIPINKSVQSDTVDVDMTVSMTGFIDSTFTMPFAVITKNINR